MDKRAFFKTSLLGLGGLFWLKKAKGLEYYPSRPDSGWAILYSTWCGTSRDASIWISEGMNGVANVFDVKENPDLTFYKHLVIGG